METKGMPLSERMTASRPNSRKVLMNTGLACSIDVEYRPLDSSRNRLKPSWMVQGIAVAAVAHLELTFEVDGPVPH